MARERSVRSKHMCDIGCCRRAYTSNLSLQRHKLEHNILRGDVSTQAALGQAGMPSPAAELCAEFIGGDNALTCLKLRQADLTTEELSNKAADLINVLGGTLSSKLLKQHSSNTAYWSYDLCIHSRWFLQRIISRTVTAMNGRANTHNKSHREDAFDNLDSILCDVWGYKWRHRGM
jgi:hypothetical protein